MINAETSLAFSVFENKGIYALLLGSGVSRSAHIPTGWEITLDLSRRVGALEGIKEQADWASWYHKRFGKDPNYSDLLDALASSATERRAILHSYIEATAEDIAEGRKVPTRAHRAIAKLVRDGFIRVIISTNFDRLLENALRDEGVEPTVVKSEDDLKGAVPLMHSRGFLLKLNGDYLDTRIRNTELELGSYSKAFSALLDRIFDEYGLIVCGWSAEWDTALRNAIARSANRRYSTYWTTRHDPSLFTKDSIEKRGARIVPISDADTFFEALQRQIEVQSSLQRENPDSVELLIATTKKYLSKGEYRIQLSDLISDEMRRLRITLDKSEFGTVGTWSEQEFRQRIARLRIVSERLARIFLIMGRWGDGSEFAFAREALREFGKHRVVAGMNIWIQLRTYPAVLFLYAYGMGALKGGRLDALLNWLRTPIDNESQLASTSAVRKLSLWDWEGSDNALWKKLEGFENRKTALSDHLHDVFKTYAQDQYISEEEFTRWFEKFELLCSLAYLTLEDFKKADLQNEMAKQDGMVRVPVGRSSWNSSVQNSLFSEINSPEERNALIKVGFAKGDAEMLDLFFNNIKRVMSRIGRGW
jgi:hypothetical protein